MTSEYKFRMLSYPLEVNVATREFIENTEAYNFIRHGLENIGILKDFPPVLCLETMLAVAYKRVPELFDEFEKLYPDVFCKYYERV